MLNQKPAYSYRSDAAIPDFDDTGVIVFMDGECAICTRGARIISAMDKKGLFKICPTQSALGQAVLTHYGLSVDDPDTWLYLEDGHAYSSLDAIIRAGNRLGGVGRLINVFAVFPRSIQDWLYRRLARNRYWLFGRTDMCAVPDEKLRARLIQ